jgi:phenylalanyl-tRNA synthetase beta chain
MKTPLKWLKQYVDINVGTDEFIRRMVMAGFEVESVEDPGAAISGVVVGRIDKLEKHPNADKLLVCTLDVGGKEPLRIVTGATNVFEGAYVPVAADGSKLPGGVAIKTSKLRGVESAGMLCSGEELRVDDALYPGASVDGILIFREAHPPGADVRPILGLSEPVVDFKITANRAADCMCMTGLAREASVVLGTKLRLPESKYVESGGRAADYLRVRVEDKALCPRYMIKIFRNVKIAESPLWMRQALAAAGVRPINNIVDITNYAMLETGQPIHAFDHRYIRGGEIIVRRAKKGETLMTLDGKVRELNEGMLVIADGEGPVGLAGIMGGEHSGIYDDTTTVALEVANFEWSQIRLTSRALGMRTEASSRLEKNLPMGLPGLALERVMALVHELGAGEIVEGVFDCNDGLPEPRKFDVSVERICALLGQKIDAGNMTAILKRLGFGVEAAGDKLSLVIPPWRQDVDAYADIAEEAQRIYGYDTIPSVPPPGEALLGRRTRRQTDMLKMKALLSGMGLDEAVTYSFMAPSALDKLGLAPGDPMRDALRLLNPIGEEYSLMRTTMAPGMLKSVALNASRKAGDAKLFEIGRVYRPKAGMEPAAPGGGYSLEEPCAETETLCIGIADEGMDFFDLKGIVEALLARFGIEGAEAIPGAAAYYHPGRSATLLLGGERIGMLGEAHPDAALAFELERKVLLAELDADRILAHARVDFSVRPLPKYPSVSRDLAVTVGRACPVGGMLASIRRAGGALLESAELFDVYEGKQAGEGRKSVAFSLIFRAADHTLVDEEANGCFEAIVRALNKEFTAEIRK